MILGNTLDEDTSWPGPDLAKTCGQMRREKRGGEFLTGRQSRRVRGCESVPESLSLRALGVVADIDMEL